MGGRFQHLRRPFRIVGQQQKTLAGLVQSPYRRHPGLIGFQKRVHRLPPFFVGGGRHHAPRFVYDEIDPGRGCDRLTVDFNAILLEANRGFGITENRAVQSDPARSDQIERD